MSQVALVVLCVATHSETASWNRPFIGGSNSVLSFTTTRCQDSSSCHQHPQLASVPFFTIRNRAVVLLVMGLIPSILILFTAVCCYNLLNLLNVIKMRGTIASTELSGGKACSNKHSRNSLSFLFPIYSLVPWTRGRVFSIGKDHLPIRFPSSLRRTLFTALSSAATQ